VRLAAGRILVGLASAAAMSHVVVTGASCGEAAVLFDDFNRWFAWLWQGKTLGITIARRG